MQCCTPKLYAAHTAHAIWLHTVDVTPCTYIWCSVQSLDRLGCWGGMMDDSAGVLFQSFLQGALVSGSRMGRDVHCLMLSIQHFLCRPQHHPPSKVTWRIVLERLSWCVTCPNHANLKFLSLGSCQKRFLWTNKEADLALHLVIGQLNSWMRLNVIILTVGVIMLLVLKCITELSSCELTLGLKQWNWCSELISTGKKKKCKGEWFVKPFPTILTARKKDTHRHIIVRGLLFSPLPQLVKS